MYKLKRLNVFQICYIFDNPNRSQKKKRKQKPSVFASHWFRSHLNSGQDLRHCIIFQILRPWFVELHFFWNGLLKLLFVFGIVSNKPMKIFNQWAFQPSSANRSMTNINSRGKIYHKKCPNLLWKMLPNNNNYDGNNRKWNHAYLLGELQLEGNTFHSILGKFRIGIKILQTNCK